MNLREHLWRSKLKLDATQLPKVSSTFQSSSTWKRQDIVLHADLKRMPHLHAQNVRAIVLRHAATMPTQGYIQGNLYIMCPLGYVFNDEASVFWAYTRVCHHINCFGPNTDYDKHVVPTWLIKHAHRVVPIPYDIWDLMIRLRWLFIMFGQTFVHPDCICSVWDYCLREKQRMYCVCAALIDAASVVDNDCPYTWASDIVSTEITTSESTARILAAAQQIELVINSNAEVEGR